MKYQLLPKPKSIAEKTGVFNISDCSVQLRGDMDYRVVKAAAKLRNALAVLDGGVHKFCRVDDEMKNSIAINHLSVHIHLSTSTASTHIPQALDTISMPA